MKISKKAIKIISWTSLMIVLVFCILFGVLIWSLSLGFSDDRKEELFWVSTSPDKSFELIIKFKEAIIFEPQDIIVYYKKMNDNEENKLFETKLYNDGKAIFPDDNCKIEWKQRNVQISFLGEEQKEETFLISFDKTVSYKQLTTARDIVNSQKIRKKLKEFERRLKNSSN